jgi:hypothetical protein
MRVTSPTFNKTLYGTNFNLSKVGYEKSQFILSGTAHSFAPTNTLSSDGKWKVTTGVSAAVHDADSRLPPDQPQAIQRVSRRGVAQCE